MFKDIIVIDDALQPFQSDNIENIFMNNSQGLIPWKLFRDVAIPDNEINDLGITELTPGIGSLIVNEHYTDSKLLNFTQHIPRMACAKAGVQFKKILQARSFIHFPLDRDIRKEYDNIHVDLPIPHMVCLYYVNDTDGDTFIFDKSRDVEINSIEDFQNKKFNVLKRVGPKKGRAVIFDGFRYHSSSGPSKNLRCILNFDFL